MLITYCENKHQIQKAKEAALEEVILGTRSLSRFNKSSLSELNEQSLLAKELGLRVVLEWDIFMTENKMLKAQSCLEAINLDYIDAIRVQDLGALEYVMSSTDKNIQLIAEGKNHNINSLKHYEEYCGSRLERLVLSLELTKEKLQEYKKQLKSQIEFLVLGRILLFYTPRNLLSALDLTEHEDEIIAMGESEESPHKGFPLIENEHGTFMFHIKHQFLLNHLEEINFVNFLRIDLRFDGDYELLSELSEKYNNSMMKDFNKEKYQFDTIRGFFKINKTNILFKKLKNQKVQRQDINYVGEVIDAQKPTHLVLQIKNKSIKTGDELKFYNPEGKEVLLKINQLKTLSGKEVDQAIKGEFAQIKYHSQLWVKSQVYK